MLPVSGALRFARVIFKPFGMEYEYFGVSTILDRAIPSSMFVAWSRKACRFGFSVSSSAGSPIFVSKFDVLSFIVCYFTQG